MMIGSGRPLAGKRIGVLGKGGAGKSTIVVLLARALRARGYPVCVLDADSTNIGMHRALGIDRPPVPLLEYFGGMVFSGGLVTCPVDDPAPLEGSDLTLEGLPRQYLARNAEGVFLLVAGKIGTLGVGAGCDGPVAKIARDLRLRSEQGAPVMLLDFKAGFEDSARGVITGLDHAVVAVDPTTASVEMASDLRDMVEEIQAGKLPATRHLQSPTLVALANRMFEDSAIKGISVVLNRVKDDEVAAYLRERLAERRLRPIGVIPEDARIAMSWLKGTPLDSTGLADAGGEILEALTLAAAERTAAKGASASA